MAHSDTQKTLDWIYDSTCRRAHQLDRSQRLYECVWYKIIRTFCLSALCPRCVHAKRGIMQCISTCIFKHVDHKTLASNTKPFCMLRLRLFSVSEDLFWESQLFFFQDRWAVISKHLEWKLSQVIIYSWNSHFHWDGRIIFQDRFSLLFALVLLSISESHFFPFDGETFHGWNGDVFASQMFIEIACFYNIHTVSLLLFLKLPWDFHTTIQLQFIVFWNQH